MKHTLQKKAFTLVELLMSLMILGILMAAVAVAFDASVTNYQVNEGIYRAANTGRQALLRITNDIRTAKEVVDNTGGDTSLTLTTANDEIMTYKFENGTLYLDDHVLIGDPSNKDYRNNGLTLKDVHFTCGLAVGKVRNVRIVMTVTDENGTVEQKLAAAAVVRRNL